ncbi:protein of unknown function [Trichlorobacter ammonificans]|uniref:Uncharacterized protein n=1 Tax=Trichlorobacter ammonificans TaxID=2916410 RepID=A0ABM9D6W6_9BACT|nr:protein of unknown function [Trichlorobacter ammonificans]
MGQRRRGTAVSIHARPLGRALPSGLRHPLGFHRCFNPRPPFGTGASRLLLAFSQHFSVSIHARPLGRALHIPRCDACNELLFQSTPALWDGRFKPTEAERTPNSQFQSTPALWDGRFSCLF